MSEKNSIHSEIVAHLKNCIKKIEEMLRSLESEFKKTEVNSRIYSLSLMLEYERQRRLDHPDALNTIAF